MDLSEWLQYRIEQEEDKAVLDSAGVVIPQNVDAKHKLEAFKEILKIFLKSYSKFASNE